MSHNATVLMGFLVEGSETKVLDKLKTVTFDANNGAIGVMSVFAHYAECVAGFIEKQTADFPGVFEYEVVPALGIWAAEQQLPGIVEFRSELARRFTEWIVDGNGYYDQARAAATEGQIDVWFVKQGKREWVASCKNKETADILVTALSA